jgi:hypothetical protein
MSVLILKFKDENGIERTVEVDRDTFTIGRHSGCDLTFVDGRLSREHVRLERDGGRFNITDLGSSNGTKLNGEELFDSGAISDGDRLDLGGGLEIEVTVKAAQTTQAQPGDAAAPNAEPVQPAAAVPTVFTAPPTPAAPEGIPTAFFIIAPVMGIFVLALVIGAVVLFGGGQKQIAANDDSGYTSDVDVPDDTDDDNDPPVPTKTGTPSGPSTPSNTGPTNSSPPGNTDLPPGGSGEFAKVEQNGAAFVRQIAQNDPKAFLTGDQAAKVGARVKQLGRSSVLAENINSARKNAAAIKTLAGQKNLKPQFLAVAAITKLGSSRGDVLQAATSVAEVYEKLGVHIGSENFDDALLMVAAYDQGAAGDTMKMRNMLQDLATKSTEGARTVRSIWFLEKAGKISTAEYDRALTFLAIGTIVQNPKEFGVNAEALRF